MFMYKCGKCGYQYNSSKEPIESIQCPAPKCRAVGMAQSLMGDASAASAADDKATADSPEVVKAKKETAVLLEQELQLAAKQRIEALKVGMSADAFKLAITKLAEREAALAAESQRLEELDSQVKADTQTNHEIQISLEAAQSKFEADKEAWAHSKVKVATISLERELDGLYAYLNTVSREIVIKNPLAVINQTKRLLVRVGRAVGKELNPNIVTEKPEIEYTDEFKTMVDTCKTVIKDAETQLGRLQNVGMSVFNQSKTLPLIRYQENRIAQAESVISEINELCAIKNGKPIEAEYSVKGV